MTRSLIIGNGQIGQALFEIFRKSHECFIRDVLPDQNDPRDVEVLHIAFPYNENFVDNVKTYMHEYRPRMVFIHSSVAVGTTKQLGGHVVHSPERGRFPNLAYEMTKFPKFIASTSEAALDYAQAYFDACDWPTYRVYDPNATELFKLVSNAHLGLEVAWRQEVERMMDSLKLSPLSKRAFSEWEGTYNEVHDKLGHKQLIRPMVKADPIGGHCVLPCIEILGESFQSSAFKFVKESNEKRKEECDRAGSGLRETVQA